MNILRTEQVLPLLRGAQPTWKTPSVTCYFGEQIFQEQSTIHDKSGYYREVVGMAMWQCSLPDRTLLKLMKQKERGKEKKGTQGIFFSACICKLAALTW